MASAAKRKASAAFEVNVTPKKLARPDEVAESVLVLAPFQPHPKLTIENVAIGTTRRLQLSVVNPNGKEMQIEFLNLPPESDGFKWSETEMRIAGNSNAVLTVEWTPSRDYKPTRHVVGVRPVGPRTRNISEISLTVSTLQTQDLRGRMKKQAKLAKTEMKMMTSSTRSTVQPLRENNSRLQVKKSTCSEINLLLAQDTEQDEIDNRRATFTKTKVRTRNDENVLTEHHWISPVLSRKPPSLTLTSEHSTPLPVLRAQSVVDLSTPAFFNKTFDVVPSADKTTCRRRSSASFSTDSLESATSKHSNKLSSTAKHVSWEKGLQSHEDRRLTRSHDQLLLSPEVCIAAEVRLTRSAERRDVDLLKVELAADMRCDGIRSSLKRSRRSSSTRRQLLTPKSQTTALFDDDFDAKIDELSFNTDTSFGLDQAIEKNIDELFGSADLGFDDFHVVDKRPQVTETVAGVKMKAETLLQECEGEETDSSTVTKARRNEVLDVSASVDSRTATKARRNEAADFSAPVDSRTVTKDRRNNALDFSIPVGLTDSGTITKARTNEILDFSAPVDSRTVTKARRNEAADFSAPFDSRTVTKGRRNDAVDFSIPVGLADSGTVMKTRTNQILDFSAPVDSRTVTKDRRNNALDFSIPVGLTDSGTITKARTNQILDFSAPVDSRTVTKARRNEAADSSAPVEQTDSTIITAEYRSEVDLSATDGRTGSITVTKANTEEIQSATEGRPAPCLLHVSPPKRIRLKPPSDSPVVLPPPSRAVRRSTVTQRKRPVMEKSAAAAVGLSRSSRSSSLTCVDQADCHSISSARSASVRRPAKPANTTNTNKTQALSVSRLVPRRLRLSSTESSVSTSSMTSLHTLVTSQTPTTSSSASSAYLCPPSPALFGHHIIDLYGNPFHQDALVYLESSFIDETEKDLLKWVNKILSPPLELQATCMMPSKEEMQCVRAPVHRNAQQPAVYRLFSVRRAATALLLSGNVAPIMSKVHAAIDKGTISVRQDKDLHRDLGLQGKVLFLLMCYNPLWLRVALEAVYGRPIPLHSNSDVVGLVGFIRRNLLSDLHLTTLHCHPKVPHLMMPPFEEKMKKFILTKFVMIVYFLDQAKTVKLIRHDPCLFCKDSPYKDSRSILVEFNKEVMAGGDMTRSLSTMGLKLMHRQTYLEEFEFRVRDRSDLRDGVRLTKLVDQLLNVRLTARLRVPAVSRIQKVHNVSLALTAFVDKTGKEIENGVTSRDVVDGHREKTLSLVWQLRDIRQQHAALVLVTYWRHNKDMIKLRMHFHRQRRAALVIQNWWRTRREAFCSERRAFLQKRRAAIKLQKWWRAKQLRERMLKMKQAALMIAERRIANLKMRADKEDFLRKKSAVISIQKWWRKGRERDANSCRVAMQEQRSHYLKLRESVIFVQRQWRAVRIQKQQRLARKQVAFARRENAALLIQQKWRAYHMMKLVRKEFVDLKKAVQLISEKRYALILMRKQRNEFKNLKKSVELISEKRKSLLLMRLQQNEFNNLKKSAIFVQRKFKATHLMRKDRARYLTLQSAVSIITERRLALINMRKCRNYFIILKKSVEIISEKRKSLLLMRSQHNEFINMKKSAVIVQRKYRATILMRKHRAHYLSMKSAVSLITERRLALIKMRKCRNDFMILKKSVEIISERRKALLLMRLQQNEFINLKRSAIIVQRKFRSMLQMRKVRTSYLSLKSAVSIITERRLALINMRKCRSELMILKKSVEIISERRKALLLMRLQQNEFINLKRSAIIVQRKFRSMLQMRKVRTSYLSLKSAVSIITERRLALINMRRCRSEFMILKKSVEMISERRKALLLMRLQQNEFINLKRSAIIVQRKFRSMLQMRKVRTSYLSLKSAVSIITERRLALINMRRCRSEFMILKKSVEMISERRKALLLMRLQRNEFINLKRYAIIVQRKFRATLQMRKDRANYLSLKKAASIITERRLALISMRKCRNEYLSQRSAIIKLQLRWRSKLAVEAKAQKKNDDEWLESARRAVAIISERRRALFMCRQARADFLKRRSAIVAIQRRWRQVLVLRQGKQLEYFNKLNQSACIIQAAVRSWLARKREERAAAIVIQRVWRGWTCRRRMRREGRAWPTQRTCVTSSNDTLETRTLRERKRGLVQALNATSYSTTQLIKLLKELGLVTRLSSLLSEELVADGVIAALHNLLDTVLIRSTACQDAALEVLSVLVNLCKQPNIAQQVWTKSVELKLPTLIFDWAAKAANGLRNNSNTKMFCACVTLLWLWAHQPQRKPTLLADSGFFVKRIGERVRGGVKPSGARKTPLPSTQPDWGYTLRINHRPRLFQDPLHAWTQLKLLLDLPK
ncbi:protein abnormal spindle isoform X2 [Nilaparvata lugens]|uniref:protein abnormal spindle isoform X2 n=1 Tax=Nilaparvata lugens TaxID=108931 RepID=UPI00193E1CB0|nr:protein abnormal spindle isoform X2 [Nilaparvata lugens]